MLILNSQWYVANWQHTCAFVSIYCMFLLLLHVILGKLYTPSALIQDSVAKMALIQYFSNHANIICIKSDIKFAESVFEKQFKLWCSFYGTTSKPRYCFKTIRFWSKYVEHKEIWNYFSLFTSDIYFWINGRSCFSPNKECTLYS